MSLLKVTARQAHTESCPRRIEELRGTVKSVAAQRRVKEYQDKAAERRTKRTKSSPEEGQTDAPTSTSSSSSSKAAPASSSNSSGDAARTGSPERAMDPARWTERGRQTVHTRKIQNTKTGSG